MNDDAVSIEHDSAASDVWQQRDELVERAKISRTWWDGIADEQRQALVVIVVDYLLQLLENPDAWIPESCEPKPGNKLDIRISLHVGDVQDEVLRRRVEAEREDAETVDDLLRIAREARRR